MYGHCHVIAIRGEGVKHKHECQINLRMFNIQEMEQVLILLNTCITNIMFT